MYNWIFDIDPPVVGLTVPAGMATLADLKEEAQKHGMDFREIRAQEYSFQEIRPLPYLKDGEVHYAPFDLEKALGITGPTLVVIDADGVPQDEVIAAFSKVASPTVKVVIKRTFFQRPIISRTDIEEIMARNAEIVGNDTFKDGIIQHSNEP